MLSNGTKVAPSFASRFGRPTFIEMFCGGGFARLGLSPRWACVFANDLCPDKAAAYARNFGPAHLAVGDILDIDPRALPTADLAWASFPCQDLSLAGQRRGMTRATRSGAFWPFNDILVALRAAQRAPKLVILENVVGALTSAKGADFRALVHALSGVGYRCGALIANAAMFTPQSRPRLFVIAVRRDLDVPSSLQGDNAGWSAPALDAAAEQLAAAGLPLIPFAPPAPRRANTSLASILEDDVPNFSRARATRILDTMSATGRAQIAIAQATASVAQRPAYGVIAMRTREHPDGSRRPRAEPRFDGLAGCLRTPGGGSSHQILVIASPDGSIALRRFTPRECARLMGAPDEYVLPDNPTRAYKLCGDAVAPPVVRYLDDTIFTPIMQANRAPAQSFRNIQSASTIGIARKSP